MYYNTLSETRARKMIRLIEERGRALKMGEAAEGERKKINRRTTHLMRHKYITKYAGVKQRLPLGNKAKEGRE